MRLRHVAALLGVVLVGLVTAASLGARPAEKSSTAGAGKASVAAAAPAGNDTLVFSGFRDGNSELYAVQPDGTGLKRLTTHHALDAFPSLSPDGSRVAFVSTRHGNSELYAMNLDGTGLVRLTNHTAIDAEPDWSPDGTRIAFTSSRTGNGDIYSASSSDGSGLARLTNHTAIDVSPAWSPDGAQLAFVSLRSGLGDVYRMQSNGSAPTRLTSSLAPDLFPAWSPDGSKLAFASLRSGNSDIYTMNPNGTQQLRRTQSAAIESEPAWSPDGSKLAISSNAPGKLNFDLYLLNANGTGATPLAPHARIDASPDWAHGTAGPQPFDGTGTPVVDATSSASATIGRAGGSLAAGGVTLTVPPGALSQGHQISMTRLTDMADSPLAGLLIAGVTLEPAGLVFLKPATLTMALPAGVSPVDVLGFGSESDGSDLHLVPRAIAGGTIEIDLWHFTTGGASSGGSAAATAMQTHQPTPAESRAQQRIAVAGPPCEAELAQGIFDGPACTHFEAEHQAALTAWFADAVKPGLEDAVGAQPSAIEAALAEWLQWAGTVEAAPETVRLALQPSIVLARELATRAVADMAQRRLENCTGVSLEEQLRDIARVADFVAAGALDITAEGLPAVEELARECAHLKIDEVLEFPAVAALLYSNTLRGLVTVDVYSGADRTDVPFTLTVDGALVSAAGDGSFQTTITPTATPVNVLLEATATNVALQNTSFDASTILARAARERVELEALGPVAISPGGTVTLRVRVAGDGMAGATVDYSSQGIGSLGATSGTTNEQGEAPVFVYTAPSDPAGGTATITAAFGNGTDSVAITVDPEILVSVSPLAVALAPGQTQQFTATVTGTPNSAVTWSETGGSIDANGLYTAGTTPGTFSVTATSVEDSTRSASASVTIVPPGTVAGVSALRRVDADAFASAACTQSGNIVTCQDTDFASPFETSALGPFSRSDSAHATIGPTDLGQSASGDASAQQVSDIALSGGRLTVSARGDGAASGTATGSACGDAPPPFSTRACGWGGSLVSLSVQFSVTGGPVQYSLSGSASQSGGDIGAPENAVRIRFRGSTAAGNVTVLDYSTKSGGQPSSSGTLAPGSYTLELESNIFADASMAAASAAFTVSLIVGG